MASASAAIKAAISGAASAVVAAPQNQTSIALAGIEFDGYPSFVARETGLGRDDDILVICLSGHRSPRQAKKLAEMGFSSVSNVHGGLMAWKKAGLPVKK